jgi:hypothetical protein
MQQCNSQPTNSAAAAHCYQRWRCYLASEVLLPTVQTVFISTPNHVKKCSQHILSKRMDAYVPYTSIHAAHDGHKHAEQPLLQQLAQLQPLQTSQRNTCIVAATTAHH